MALYDFLPKYKQVEPNNLKGLQPGFVVSQLPVASTNSTFTQEKYNLADSTSTATTNHIANGHIVTIGKDGIKDPVVGDSLFIVYNEPLNTVFNANKFYSTDINHECLRLVQLMPGDEWMSDMSLELGSNASDPLYGRIVSIASTDGVGQSDDFFTCTTLADGTTAYHYMFIK